MFPVSTDTAERTFSTEMIKNSVAVIKKIESIRYRQRVHARVMYVTGRVYAIGLFEKQRICRDSF